MKKVTKSELIKLVQELQIDEQNWHYHLLTPTCQFNKSGQFAIIVENVDSKEIFVYYSDVAEMEISNQFSKMVHGKEVMDKKNTKANYKPSKDVVAILNLINELTEKGIKWHHHVFFPGCIFNNREAEFELVVEDPRSNRRLISVSKTEPIEDLKQIESVFYAQDI